jgi:hypothetical protein
LEIFQNLFDAREGDDFHTNLDGSVTLLSKFATISEHVDLDKVAEDFKQLLNQINTVTNDMRTLTTYVQWATLSNQYTWATVVEVNNNRMSKESGVADVLSKDTNNELKEAAKKTPQTRVREEGGSHRSKRKRTYHRGYWSPSAADGHMDRQRGSGFGRGGLHQAGYGRGGGRAAGGGPGRGAGAAGL